MAYTRFSKRYYRCIRCGSDIVEPLDNWKAKKQKNKNICHGCLERQRLKQLDKQEEMKYSAKYTW